MGAARRGGRRCAGRRCCHRCRCCRWRREAAGAAWQQAQHRGQAGRRPAPHAALLRGGGAPGAGVGGGGAQGRGGSGAAVCVCARRVAGSGGVYVGRLRHASLKGWGWGEGGCRARVCRARPAVRRPRPHGRPGAFTAPHCSRRRDRGASYPLQQAAAAPVRHPGCCRPGRGRASPVGLVGGLRLRHDCRRHDQGAAKCADRRGESPAPGAGAPEARHPHQGCAGSGWKA
jgi:hypothetical protein